MTHFLQRLNRGLARGEAIFAATVLLAMIFVAAAQALFRNLANEEIEWANLALQQISWSDSFLQKGTLWLAFLGASLATYDEKHIAIDVLQRIAKPRMKQFLRAIVAAFAAVTSFYLARVFWLSILNNSKGIPVDYSMLNAQDQMIHLCNASPQLLANADISPSPIFCLLREGLTAFGVTVPTPQIAMELVVPAILIFMSIRFLMRTGAAIRSLITNSQLPNEPPIEES